MLALSPTFEIVNYGCSTASMYNPDHILVPIIHLLMFGVCGYQCPVARTEILSIGAVGSADNSSVTAHCVDDGIWIW